MHLLASGVERIDDGETAVDLDQPPGDIVILSAADSELTALAAAASSALGLSVRFANLGRLAHPLSVDLYIEKTLCKARLILVRMMGGESYWPYGLDQLRALSRAGGPQLIVVPGEAEWDRNLETFTSVPVDTARRLWRYLVEGGAVNYTNALKYMAWLLDAAEEPPPPLAIPRAGYYWPGVGAIELGQLQQYLTSGRPYAPLIFYRAHLLGGLTAPIDALAEALDGVGLNPVPIFVSSLKEVEAAAFLDDSFSQLRPSIILNTTAFAVSSIGGTSGATVLDKPGRPVLQVVLAGTSEAAWRESARGLPARDLTMNVVLPEVDGRILTRAVSFKSEVPGGLVTHEPVADRIDFVAKQAAAWARLAKPASERRIAIILSNYPNRDGRIANGVGLDSPGSVTGLLRALSGCGCPIPNAPATTQELMTLLLAGPTNATRRRSEARLTAADYRTFFDALPAALQAAVTARWGEPEADPHFADGGFDLALHRFGHVVIGIQPARGYNIDPKATYHDPDLVPPHHYLAFYAWLRESFAADAIVHLGKHGNLEWLPGKALGLSRECWPEALLGPVPLIYPFIVNDPGEGSQAKRRSSAVIIDHLMPAMTRAEIHGGLAELETLIDEYYLAAGVDARRRKYLEAEILSTAERHGLDRDLGLTRDSGDEALRSLDAHLCELKEMQIRDGLHVLGNTPDRRQRTDTLIAIARVPRPGGRPADESLHRAIAADLEFAGFDPLDCDMAADWRGPRPALLEQAADGPWRTQGDTVERIETVAAAVIEGERGDQPVPGPRSAAVLGWIVSELAPALDSSGAKEIEAVLTALDGRFVAPGPSGAPTRGRPEVLPTGRNFYSVDVRAVPTAAAWALGRQAADGLALRYFQDEGEWPRAIAMSAWGTSNMRTGGDDIAQVLALIGAKPVWDTGTGRVTGFSVLPLAELGRPRIDVTLRISGMFRDAFPEQIDLIDSAMRAVAALDEPEDANPIAESARRGTAELIAAGIDPEQARTRAAARVFGAKPGAYGAGLQALIDEGVWDSRGDLAEAFLAWGGFVYGGGDEGRGDQGLLTQRLAEADAVFQAQDNREHDILDSDDYYQFQGGLAATVEMLKGTAPRVYHGDHSRPEKPVVRSLSEEIARVVRGRGANPKWIAGMMRHGYKGAFEMAATLDYLFAYAATTEAVQDHHFDQLFEAYVGDKDVRAFIAENNAPALAEMTARFREAIDRGLWVPRINSVHERLAALTQKSREAAE